MSVVVEVISKETVLVKTKEEEFEIEATSEEVLNINKTSSNNSSQHSVRAVAVEGVAAEATAEATVRTAARNEVTTEAGISGPTEKVTQRRSMA